MVGGGKFQPLSKRAATAVLLASLPFVLCISQAAAASPSTASSPAGDNIPEWVKATAQAGGFGRSEFAEIEAYRKLSAKRKLQEDLEQTFDEEGRRSSGVSNTRRTDLTEEDKERLNAAMETRIDVLQDGAGVVESIFEFENYSCEYGVVEATKGRSLLFMYCVHMFSYISTASM